MRIWEFIKRDWFELSSALVLCTLVFLFWKFAGVI